MKASITKKVLKDGRWLLCSQEGKHGKIHMSLTKGQRKELLEMLKEEANETV